MTQNDKHSLVRKWVEFWGRQRIMKTIVFTESSIWTQPFTINVGEIGYYLLVPPTTAAIFTSSTGIKQVFTEGGYLELQEGAYTLQYVDLSERIFTLPKITTSTVDDYSVSIIVSIFFKVEFPSQIIRSSSPFKVLISICEAAIKRYIRIHRYEELIGENRSIKYSQFAQFIRESVTQSKACKAFYLIDILFEEQHANSGSDSLDQKDNFHELRNRAKQNEIDEQKGDFRRAWIEYWGRKNIMEPIQFSETSILTQPTSVKIGTHGYFLTLPSMTAASITSPVGRKMVFTEGGYQEFQEGVYSIQYIDLRERFFTLPTITDSSVDGLKVSIVVSLAFQVISPLRINVSKPLTQFFSVIEDVIREFIRSHSYEEFFGIESVNDDKISKYIIQKVTDYEVCKAFTLIDVIIVERYGHLDGNRRLKPSKPEEIKSHIGGGKNNNKDEIHIQEYIDADKNKLWDIFISHAFEDKPFARALADELVGKGMRVWFDEFELKIGDSLSRKIDFGLSNSRFGIVILSPNFFAKNWTQKELGALTARETSGENIILPIWHNISIDEIRRKSPILADKFGISSDIALDEMIIQILNKVQSY